MGDDDYTLDGTDMGADELGAEAGVDPAQPEPSAVEPAAPASPAWAPDPGEWQQLVESNRQMQQILQQAMQPAEEQLPELNPYDDSFGENIEQRLTRMQEQLTQTVQQAVQPIYQQQADHWVDETIGNLPQKVGHEFTAESLDLLRGTARQVPGDENGTTWLAQQVAGIEKAAYARGVEAMKKSLGQPTVDGGPAGGGAGSEVIDAPTDYDSIIDAFAARNNV